MALMWHHATGGKGQKDMVVLPYKDRLLLFSRYLQQLVMESIGKQLDLKGNRVEQGLAVYGNKGSTDQHAYVQQLREGVPNFFAVFVRVLEDGGSPREVEPGATAGDYLHGFLLGTRAALFENGRESMTITVPRVDARTVGALIALFERAVGLYAGLVGINAYHQPGVEAGKKAAAAVLALQAQVLAALSATPQTAEQIASSIRELASAETVYLLLEHLAANGRARSRISTARPSSASAGRCGANRDDLRASAGTGAGRDRHRPRVGAGGVGLRRASGRAGPLGTAARPRRADVGRHRPDRDRTRRASAWA